jgi:hypothetical protein
VKTDGAQSPASGLPRRPAFGDRPRRIEV